MASVQIINPEVPNYAQWDWNPGSVAVAAAGAGQKMMTGISQERREQEEFELEKILFPSKKKAAELQLAKIQSEIKENNARADYYLGQADADGLGASSFGGDAINQRIAMIAGGSDYGYLWGSPAKVAPTKEVAPAKKTMTF